MKKLQTLLIWLVGIGVIVLIISFGIADSLKTRMNKEIQGGDEVKVEHPDADAYYSSNGQLVNSYQVKDSQKVQSEKQINKDVRNRGFGDYPISYEYSANGDYVKEQEAKKTNEKHPIYQTYYVSSSGDYWTITVINGNVMANPLTYNLESGADVQLIFAESNVITSYDSKTNKFYETVPDPSVLNVKVVDHIDAQTLDSLTVEVIKGL